MVMTAVSLSFSIADLTLRRVRVFDNIRQCLMDDADQLNFNLRREVKDFGMSSFEIHGNFPDFAKVPDKITKSSDEPERHSLKAKARKPNIDSRRF